MNATQISTPVAILEGMTPCVPTKTCEFHPFRVWAWRCFADGWVCVAGFADRADARLFVGLQRGRTHDLYLQSPAGVERFTPEMR